MKKIISLVAAVSASLALAGCGAAAVRTTVIDNTKPDQGWQAHCPKGLPPAQPLLCRYDNKYHKGSVHVVKSHFPKLNKAADVAQAYAQERQRQGTAVSIIRTTISGANSAFNTSWTNEGKNKESLLMFIQLSNPEEVVVIVASWAEGDAIAQASAEEFVTNLSFDGTLD